MTAQYFAKSYGKVYGTGAAAASEYSGVLRVYSFAIPELTWVVTHNLGTYNFIASLVDSDGNQFFAKTTAVSDNQFVVYLTEPTSGSVFVTFGL
jgi:hypothetical protein